MNIILFLSGLLILRGTLHWTNYKFTMRRTYLQKIQKIREITRAFHAACVLGGCGGGDKGTLILGEWGTPQTRFSSASSSCTSNPHPALALSSDARFNRCKLAPLFLPPPLPTFSFPLSFLAGMSFVGGGSAFPPSVLPSGCSAPWPARQVNRPHLPPVLFAHAMSRRPCPCLCLSPRARTISLSLLRFLSPRPFRACFSFTLPRIFCPFPFRPSFFLVPFSWNLSLSAPPALFAFRSRTH